MAPRLLVCAPLECERRALLGTLDGPTVLRRTGCGPVRSARAVRGLSTAPFDAMAVAGLAGGLAEQVRSGDVVVASEIIREDRTVHRCPSAPLLTGELRRRGLVVHCGPVLSVDHVVRGAERKALSASGALAVDMESAALAPLAGDGPLAVIRVVVDTRRAPLVDPAVAGRGLRALRGLRCAGPALGRWARSVGDRRVVLAPRGSRSGRTAAQCTDVVVLRSSLGEPGAIRDVVSAHHVAGPTDLRLEWLRDVVRISPTATAPTWWIEDLVAALRGLGRVDVENRVTEENYRFGRPKEVS